MMASPSQHHTVALGLVRTIVPYTILELEDGRKADYDTHCTVGVVISFLPKRKFEELAFQLTEGFKTQLQFVCFLQFKTQSPDLASAHAQPAANLNYRLASRSFHPLPQSAKLWVNSPPRIFVRYLGAAFLSTLLHWGRGGAN